jgi:hypothetical protein
LKLGFRQCPITEVGHRTWELRSFNRLSADITDLVLVTGDDLPGMDVLIDVGLVPLSSAPGDTVDLLEDVRL